MSTPGESSGPKEARDQECLGPRLATAMGQGCWQGCALCQRNTATCRALHREIGLPVPTLLPTASCWDSPLAELAWRTARAECRSHTGPRLGFRGLDRVLGTSGRPLVPSAPHGGPMSRERTIQTYLYPASFAVLPDAESALGWGNKAKCRSALHGQTLHRIHLSTPPLSQCLCRDTMKAWGSPIHSRIEWQGGQLPAIGPRKAGTTL